METELRGMALRRAVAAWDHAGRHGQRDLTPACLDVDELFERAGRRVAGDHQALSRESDTVLIVAKAPHSGSFESIVHIAARCLAFGLEIASVRILEPSVAFDVAHALYPDVWMNFARPPVGERYWARLKILFESPSFAEIFGEPFDPSMVKEGQRVCEENDLTLAEFAAVWEQGRHPLARDHARRTYGQRAVDVIFDGVDGRDEFDWYRSSLPFGIQKVAPSVMAFALRDERLYHGKPTVVVNGQFALLSRLFEYRDHGAVILELGLPQHCTAADFRRLLIGDSDVPNACLPGSIRRDAADGFFPLDDPSPVTPWANVVHASDGYLSGAIEARLLLARPGASRVRAVLGREGYTDYEIDEVILEDPVVVSHEGELRLTRLTKGRSLEACLDGIRHWFPSLHALHGGEVRDAPLRALLEFASGLESGSKSEEAVPAPGDRPSRAIRHRDDLPPEMTAIGNGVLRRGGVGCLVPLAGGGGRFVRYEAQEGSAARLKALLPLFGNRTVSALDVRAAHLRDLAGRGAPVGLFLSCSHHTEAPVMAWAGSSVDLAPDVGRVPELYRVRAPSDDGAVYSNRWNAISNILRASDGRPLVKPLGSMGLLWAFFSSGALQRWIQRGIEYVVAANADDVGFRIDPAIVGMLADHNHLEAVVLATSLANVAPGGVRPTKGGALRDRLTPSGLASRYVLENATNITGAEAPLSTNQIYFRTLSLLRALRNVVSGSLNDLPYYLETKRARSGDLDTLALHVYQPYCDVLRVMDTVEACEMHAAPHRGQPGAFQPLKTPDDVPQAQETIDRLAMLDDDIRTGGGAQ